MSETADLSELQNRLEKAERTGLDGAASLYRDRIFVLQADDEPDEAPLSEDTAAPEDSALYAALTGMDRSTGDGAEDENRVAALRERQDVAEEAGLDAAAGYYAEQRAALGDEQEPAEEPTTPDAKVALAAAETPGASQEKQAAAALTEKELAAEEAGMDGAADYFRTERAKL